MRIGHRLATAHKQHGTATERVQFVDDRHQLVTAQALAAVFLMHGVVNAKAAIVIARVGRIEFDTQRKRVFSCQVALHEIRLFQHP